MKILQYTAESGLQEIDFETPWQNGEDREVWLDRAGFYRFADHDSPDSQTRECGHQVLVYRSRGENNYAALVEVADVNHWADIVVRTEKDLLHLRMFLVPWHLLGVISRFDRLVQTAEKAFHVWHHHKVEIACPECDLEESRREQNDAREREERRKQRKEASESS